MNCYWCNLGGRVIYYFGTFSSGSMVRNSSQCRSHRKCRLNTWVEKILWRRKWQLRGAGMRTSAHGKGHEEGVSTYAKVGLSLRSPPGNSRASTPKTSVCLLSALCFHLPLLFIGGCPPLPLSEKRVSLQLPLIIPGCDSVSTYKLLWKSSSLPEWVFPATCDCSEPANCERQEMF